MIEYDLLNRAMRTATYRHRTELNRESLGLNTAVHPQNPQNQETFLRIGEFFRIPKDYIQQDHVLISLTLVEHSETS